ncbi:MAG: NAD(P)H-hydrate dehydratase [Desulfuromonadales bacterium]
MKVLNTQQMQAVDRRTIEDVGIPGVVLMENAGRGVAEQILTRYRSSGAQRALVLAGKGNNGGDGYVVARHLLDHDWDVLTLVFAPSQEISGDAEINLKALKNCGGAVEHVLSSDVLYALLDDAGEFTVVVDALFGTGLTKPVEGLFRDIIGWINCQTCPVVAVDIASGIDGSTGRIMGDAVNADLTVTFAFPKIGHVTYPGAGHVGALSVVDIGIPAQLIYAAEANCRLLTAEEARWFVPVRQADGHKGTYGHLLVLAGATGTSGAAVMAAEAGLRSGAGLVTLACPQSVQPVVASQLTEVMTVPLAEVNGEVSLQALDDLLSLSAGKRALAIGPGLGSGDEIQGLIRRLVQDADLPMVVDADGLNALSGHVQLLQRQRDQAIVLTPHPGEMARLTGLTPAQIQADRFRVARDFAVQHQVVLVLKGARTLIAAPDGTVHVNSTGHAGMASGGMGDVLTGLIGGLLAQGLEAMTAASLGVYLHGAAAERLESTFGDAGLLATDVIYELPAARRALAGE